MSDYAKRIRRNKQLRRERLLRARRLGTHTSQEWEALKAEFDYRCVKCGSGSYHVEHDHIRPLYQDGSSDGIENIQPLCAWCNVGKGPDSFNWKEYRRKYGWNGSTAARSDECRG